MTESEAYIVLNMLPHIGPIRAQKLVEVFETPSAVLRAPVKQLCQIPGIGPEVAQVILKWEEHADLLHELAEAKKIDAKILTLADGGYPENLRNIPDAPLVLYVKGELKECDQHAIALVGSRSSSYYGRETARKLGYQLAYAGMTVVSGLARGIDTAAHEGALAAKGRTIAVLGCGINQIYPAENVPLAEKMMHSGALIAEFPIGTKPDKQTFPIRNRVVSGLSQGVVVVEAAIGSGAMITAKMALEYGRQIFAVPGRVDVPSSKGCHALIKQGAKLVETAQDICQEFEFLFPTQFLESCEREIPSGLSEEELKIYKTLGTEERHVDWIIRTCGLPASRVSSSLLRLEMKKLARSLPGKFFVRIQ